MIRTLSLIGLLCLSVGLHAQGVFSVDRNMEAHLSPYFTENNIHLPVLSSERDVDLEILALHNKSIEQSNSVRSLGARQNIENIIAEITQGKLLYRRVTCSNTNCEIVIVSSNIDGSSKEAEGIVNQFSDNIAKPNEYYKIVAPSMIIRGSNTDHGFSMLFFVKIL